MSYGLDFTKENLSESLARANDYLSHNQSRSDLTLNSETFKLGLYIVNKSCKDEQLDFVDVAA